MTMQYPPCKCGRPIDRFAYYKQDGMCSICYTAKMKRKRQIPYELDED